MFGFRRKKEDPMQTELRKLREDAEQRRDEGVVGVSDFLMIVEDVFSITGRGIVATGKISSGTIREGDTVLINGGRRVRVAGIEMFRKTTNSATVGDLVGLLLEGVSRDDLKKGQRLTK